MDKSRDIRIPAPSITAMGGYPTQIFPEEHLGIEYRSDKTILERNSTNISGQDKIRIRTKTKSSNKGMRRKGIDTSNQMIYFDNM